MDRANGFYPFGREFESLQRGVVNRRKRWVNPADNLPPGWRRELAILRREQIAARKRAFLDARRGKLSAWLLLRK